MTVTAPDLPNWHDLTTDARKAHVLPLWLEGKSAGEIAATFRNASRNAVIGIVNRAKMKRGKTAPAKNPRKPRTPRVKPPMAIKPKPHEHPDRVVSIDIDPPVSASKWIDQDRPPLPGATPISIMDLPNREGIVCRFPVQGGFCGVASGDHTYCETHRRYAYTARTEV